MSYLPNRAKVSTDNSTNTPLGIGGEFIGAWEDVSQYSTITVLYESDVSSKQNGLTLEFSTDGVSQIRKTELTSKVQPDDSKRFGGLHEITVFSRFFRVRYLNSNVAQSSFDLQTIYSTTRNSELSSIADSSIDDSNERILKDENNKKVGVTNGSLDTNLDGTSVECILNLILEETKKTNTYLALMLDGEL